MVYDPDYRGKISQKTQLMNLDYSAPTVTLALQTGSDTDTPPTGRTSSPAGRSSHADHGPDFLRPEPLPVDVGAAQIVNAPLGVLLGVEPWNFPLYQIVLKVA